MASVSAPPPGIADPSRRTLTNPVMKDKVTFTRYSAETGGQSTHFRVTVAPGGGPPLHYHDTYTETFRPLVGITTIHLNGAAILLHPGTSDAVTVPLAKVHDFKNETDQDIELEGELNPGSEGFEKSIYVLYGLARDGRCNSDGTPKGFVENCLAFEMGDMRLPGVMGTVGVPIIKATVRFARWMRWERELVERYWL